MKSCASHRWGIAWLFASVTACAALFLASGVSIANAQTLLSGLCQGRGYNLSMAQREACGDESFPLTRVEPMAYGGHAYVYETSAGTATFFVPPSSFDAATASTAELEAFGYPLPPSQASTKYAVWRERMQSMHPETPARELIFSPDRPPKTGTIYPATSPNWAGFSDYSSTESYREAEGYWTVPPITHPCTGTEASASIWPGLTTNYQVYSHYYERWEEGEIIQAGTEEGWEVPGGEAELWWELYPQTPPVPFEHENIVPPYTGMTAFVQYKGTYLAHFFIGVDGHAGHSFNFEPRYPIRVGEEANFTTESEDPPPIGSGELSGFERFWFIGYAADSVGGFGEPVGEAPSILDYTMKDFGSVMAETAHEFGGYNEEEFMTSHVSCG